MFIKTNRTVNTKILTILLAAAMLVAGGLDADAASRKKKKRRGMTPWKKTALKFCVLFLLAAGKRQV